MKKVLRFAVLAAIAMPATGMWAYSFEENGIYYNETADNTLEVTFKDKTYASYAGDLVIPQTVEHNGVTYTVTSIGKYAVRKCFENLKSVTMPATITKIGSGAFSECTAITTVTIPDNTETIDTYAFNSCARLKEIKWGKSLKTIGAGAFMYCWSLTDVNIPEGVTQVLQNAFQNCWNLKTVSVPASVAKFGQSPFRDCSHIVSITVDAANENYSSADGILYNKDKTELIQYNGGRNAASFTIPQGVKTLAYYSFAADSALVEVTIPASVETIYNTAFYKSPKIERVNISESVTTIGKQAFMGCKALKEAVIPNSVTDVQDQAFSECEALQSVSFGTGITKLGAKVFQKSAAITSVSVGAATPPTCGASVFDDGVYTAATLYVPAAAAASYKEAATWSSFTKIENASTSGIDRPDVDNAVAVSYVQPDGRVSAQPAKGLNIVRMSDGSVKKIVVR